MDFELMISSFPKLLNATVITLKLLSLSLFFGLFIGLLFAILRMNKNPVVNKFAYGLKVQRIAMPKFFVKDPQYGDAVVIIPKHNPVPYIKRLIGMPGDVVRIINKQIYINGEALERKFIESEEIILKKRYRLSNGTIETRESEAIGDLFSENIGNASYVIRNTRGQNNQFPQEWTVPEGHYFVMGDNRDNSNDSTEDVGFVPRENFFGRADYLWMTWECWLCLPSFEKAGKIN